MNTNLCLFPMLFFLQVLTLCSGNYVQEHNAIRSMVDPPAANMKKLMYSRELESIAQQHASGCSFNHNDYRSRQSHVFSSVGENIFYGRKGDNITDAIEYWREQGDYYNIRTNECQLFKFCDYYTQVTWADSNYVGCGKSDCGENSFIVCNYASSSTLNQRPYLPGSSCAACSRHYVCQEKLCILTFK
ncbi:glioma pathogenesis-related protein 1-like [Crassostrea angulata]|uniref:glioma pathogenesis-related protein 1-like n=1 Tax=Magallana angulata TaxID=2784310 RepID=UPI0022B11720|nr:glioma pathogenesis-related protein 1-like [Crassostrea angulata]